MQPVPVPVFGTIDNIFRYITCRKQFYPTNFKEILSFFVSNSEIQIRCKLGRSGYIAPAHGQDRGSAILQTKEFNMRKFVTALVGSAMLVSALPASATPIQTRQLPEIQAAYPNESYAQYYYRRGYHHRPYYRDRYYRRDSGAAVAAGVAGLAAGALIAGAIASQAQPAAPPPPGTVDPSVAAYCARKYRSYDPGTGTFLASNGMRYVCTYP
jgi:hypothetical protein